MSNQNLRNSDDQRDRNNAHHALVKKSQANEHIHIGMMLTQCAGSHEGHPACLKGRPELHATGEIYTSSDESDDLRMFVQKERGRVCTIQNLDTGVSSLVHRPQSIALSSKSFHRYTWTCIKKHHAKSITITFPHTMVSRTPKAVWDPVDPFSIISFHSWVLRDRELNFSQKPSRSETYGSVMP